MLRHTFQSWGLPDRVRVDHGHPWGSRNDLPRALALWLIGLGVGVIGNKPNCPRMNGMVERTQGVTEPWAEPWLRDRQSLPGRLVWAIPIQRAVYPAIDGRRRLDAFPGLLTPRRPYRIEQEEQLWKLDRVDQYMSQFVWRRWVNRSGLIALYPWDLSVGRAGKGQPVSVRFERSDRSGVIQDSRGGELCRHPAVQLTRERIMGLAVSHRRAGSQKIR